MQTCCYVSHHLTVGSSHSSLNEGQAVVKRSQCIMSNRESLLCTTHIEHISQLLTALVSEFMRPFASVSVLSMANSFNCLLQAIDSVNNFFLLLLFLHNHVYCVNPCGSCDSLLLQMIKPCQNSTKETMNTKQGPADFRFYFSPKLSSVKTAEEGRRLDFSFPFPSLPSQQSHCPSGHNSG